MSKGPYYQPGTYRFRVTDQGFGETPKATPYFFIRGLPCKQLTNEGDYDVREYEREIVLYLSDKAVDISVDKLRAMGWQGSSFRELDPTSSDAHLFVDQTIVVECDHEENDKGTWEKWNLPRATSANADKPPKPKSDPKIASKLDAMFSKSLKPATGAKTTDKPKSPPPRNAPVSTGANGEVEIPF